MSRPRLVYDDDCGFCTRAAKAVERNDGIEIVPFSAVSGDLVERLPPDWRNCAHLVTDDRVYSCGAAMEEAAVRAGLVPAGLVLTLRRLPGHDRVLESGYSVVARNRPFFGRVTRRLF